MIFSALHRYDRKKWLEHVSVHSREWKIRINKEMSSSRSKKYILECSMSWI